MLRFYFVYIALSFFTLTCNAVDKDEIYRPYAPDGIPFIISDTPWKVDRQGNHRAVVKVTQESNHAVRVLLPWRRPDLRPETKRVRIVDAASGDTVQNIKVCSLTSESGEIIFQPKTVPGEYYIYYLPYNYRQEADDARYGDPWNDYLSPIYEADKSWMNGLPKDLSSLPLATVVRFEARSAFDYFTVMGTIATDHETQNILAHHPESPILFQEDRVYAIRLSDRLPVRWVQTGLHADYNGNAMRNEYFVWQVGVWASRHDVNNVHLTFSDLVNAKAGTVISKDSITCFNLGGTNWDGSPLTFQVNVAHGKIQPLWCGIQIPSNAATGTYVGKIIFSADGTKPQELRVFIQVSDSLLSDKGDGDLWRLARLRWLNSTIGMDNHPIEPFQAMQIKGNVIKATNKQLTLGANGFPTSITINRKQILSKPMAFVVVTDKGPLTFKAEDIDIIQKTDGLVTWQARSKQGNISFDCKAEMEYDGYIDYHVTVTAEERVELKDIRLVTEYTPYVSTYFMGIGYKGGYRPTDFSWNWEGPYDSYWMGNALAGLHVEYRGKTYNGPLLNDYKPAPPEVWVNDGKGSIIVSGDKGSSTRVLTSTGNMILDQEGKTLEFALIITPAKPVDTRKQFSQRYYQAEEKNFDKAAEEEANIMNIHQSREMNPFINYPFIVRDTLVAFINHEHQFGRKVKLYYTIRELSNYCAEIYALKSLNHEIFVKGAGYGEPWLCEHLIDDYKPAWYSPVSGERQDASLALTGFSRWINYYLEGYRWMFENYHIDGLYMDDVSFDREVMKRIRKIMVKYQPGSLIDLHSNTWYSVGPANQYTGFFPYVDRLWFGESFRYNQMMPDEWFVTFSGIPFGQMSEMLQGGGNKYLGMIYGTAGRHSWTKVSPAPVWKVWKDFGIADALMLGYWDDRCPVTTDHELVKATAYVKAGKVLIAIGNFDSQDHNIHLHIDWGTLKMNPRKVILQAPAVEDFQPATSFRIDDTIPVKVKQGWLLLTQNNVPEKD